ncbi:TPA: hypothetical protein ACTW6K_005084 [Raoultella planticola]
MLFPLFSTDMAQEQADDDAPMTRSCAGTSHIAAPTEQYSGPRSD